MHVYQGWSFMTCIAACSFKDAVVVSRHFALACYADLEMPENLSIGAWVHTTYIGYCTKSEAKMRPGCGHAIRCHGKRASMLHASFLQTIFQVCELTSRLISYSSSLHSKLTASIRLLAAT